RSWRRNGDDDDGAMVGWWRSNGVVTSVVWQ
ncbi:hypothetical protein Tco_1511318, partial [Tanacetum coccineum]